MLTTATKFHHNVLPEIGEIGRLVIGWDRWGKPCQAVGGFPGGRRPARVIVEAYPLTDSADVRYSWGVHTAFFKRLSDGRTFRASGFWFEKEAP